MKMTNTSRKTILILGIIFVTIIMVSSATAVPQISSKLLTEKITKIEKRENDLNNAEQINKKVVNQDKIKSNGFLEKIKNYLNGNSPLSKLSEIINELASYKDNKKTGDWPLLSFIVLFLVCLIFWPFVLAFTAVTGVFSGIDAWISLTGLWGPLGFIVGLPFGILLCLLWWFIGITWPIWAPFEAYYGYPSYSPEE